MDIIMLLIIITVIKSVIDSQKAKDKSKSREAERQSGGQTRPPERREANSAPRAPQGRQTAPQPNGLEEIFGQMMGKMKESLAPETEQAKPKKASSSQTKKKKSSATDPTKGKSKSKPQAQTAAASHQERQERSEHERLKPSVKPVKSVFEEKDGCGHRVELNPHIDYGKSQAQKRPDRVAIQVRHDEDTILQSIIWAEILAKPKALENMERYSRR